MQETGRESVWKEDPEVPGKPGGALAQGVGEQVACEVLT